MRSSSAAFYVHEVTAPGSISVTGSILENVFVFTSGNAGVVFEENRFLGAAHLRLFSRRPVRVLGNAFETKRPILTEIALPRSEIARNAFASESVIFQPHAQRLTGKDTLRTYQDLPVVLGNTVTVTGGGELALPRGLEVRHDYFVSFRVIGSVTVSPWFTAQAGMTPTGVAFGARTAGYELKLIGTYPNPGSSNVRLEYYVATGRHVMVTIFDVHGRMVHRLDVGYVPPGAHSLEMGVSALAIGLYFARVEAGSAALGARFLVAR